MAARGSRAAASGRHASGYSLVEAIVVLGLVGGLAAIAVPVLSRAQDAAEAASAAHYVASLVARARFDAARQQRTVALRFLATTPPSFVRVVDGDGDGVTAADIASGVDRVSGPADRLEDHFGRARFGVSGAVSAIGETRTLGGSDDPIRFGVARQISVSPLGSATSGTAYVTSEAGVQFAVRIAGVTGRARVLRYDRGRGTWQPY
ncbi:MAG: Tfp pilus assembly protein FimT/FimU [Vicinamibacterales bacterium]